MSAKGRGFFLLQKKGENMMNIEDRLDRQEFDLKRLKRHNRWLLGAIVLVAGGLIVPLLFETTAFRARAQSGGTAKEIRARSFILEDENGKSRAALLASKDGAGLALYDKNGELLAALGVIKDRPTLALYDEKGKIRAYLAADEDGPLLVLRDENGKIRFVAGKTKVVTSDGTTFEYPESSLILFEPDGKVVWSAIK
jgi:hypothetical protein